MKHTELLNNLSEAESAVQGAKTQLQDFLYPILEALGHNPQGEWIESTWESKDNLNITTGWTSRGCSNSTDYKIPLSVLRSEDPVAAATQWKEQKALQDAERTRQETLAQIARLQQTLIK